MASLSSSPPYSAAVPRLGGITIQLPPSLRENLMKGRQRILQHQEQGAEKTALLHTLTNTTVRTSLAAINLAAAASSSSVARLRGINVGSDEINAWREEEEQEEVEDHEEEEELDEYRRQFEKECDEAVVSTFPFQHSLPESSDDDYTEENSPESFPSTSSDDESLSPPPSLPLVVISLEKLCGYIPQTLEDYLLQKKHVEEALYGITGKDQKTEDHVLSSIHFSNHASELLELGIAIHSDTIQTCISSSTAIKDSVIIPYPEYILMNTKYSFGSNTSDEHRLLKVSTMWKYILRSHPIPVVERLLKYLRMCNRDIQWKYYMTHYIRNDVVKKEISLQDKKRKILSMQEFKQRRANELEKLYETRDVFERLVEETLDKQHELEERRRQSETTDLASETFDFLVQQQKKSQHKNQDDSSSYNSKEGKQDKPTRFSPESTLKSTEELNTETLVRAWNQRLAKIDALIESMQDDQWAEEEQEEEGVNIMAFEAEEAEADADHLSLLDQILAMIMGKITPPSTDIMEEHVQYIFTVHHTIVREWKDYFGRLPPPAGAEALRESSETCQSNDGNTSVISLKSTAVDENDTLVTVLERLSVDHWEDLLEKPDDNIDKSSQEHPSHLDGGKNIKKHGGLRPGGNI